MPSQMGKIRWWVNKRTHEDTYSMFIFGFGFLLNWMCVVLSHKIMGNMNSKEQVSTFL